MNGAIQPLGGEPGVQNAYGHHRQKHRHDHVPDLIQPLGEKPGALGVHVNPAHIGVLGEIQAQRLAVDGALGGGDAFAERLGIIHQRAEGIGFARAADQRALAVKDHQAAVVVQHHIGKGSGNGGIFQVDNEIIGFHAAVGGREWQGAYQGNHICRGGGEGKGNGADKRAEGGEEGAPQAQEKIPVVIQGDF